MNVIKAVRKRGGLDNSVKAHTDIHESLIEGFLETDQQFLSTVEARSGNPAVVACIVGDQIWCANIGDSRAVLCRGHHAVQLSLDHKPDRKDEEERIKAAGGRV